MIDPRSLATLLTHHPDTACRIAHEVAAEPLASLPALTILAGQLPRSAVEAARPDEAFAPPTDDRPVAMVLQAIGQEDLALRLRLDRMPAAKDETLVRLGRLLTSTLSPHTDGFRLRPPSILVLGPGAGPAPFSPGSAQLLLTLRGSPAVRRGGDSKDDPAMTADVLGSTPEGEGVFIPAGMAFCLRNGHLPAVQLVFPWELRARGPKAVSGGRRRLGRLGEARRFLRRKSSRRRPA